MKTLKKITICFIISLAAIACVERDCFSFSVNKYAIENTNNAENSDNSISPGIDIVEVDVTLSESIFFFDLKDLSSEKVITIVSFFTKSTFFSIWQPPKVS